MKWSHLPVAGGLYDQHPKLIVQFEYIFSARAKHEEKKRKEDQRKRDAEARRGGGGRTAGRRRGG